MFFSRTSAADRENEKRVVGLELADLQPLGEDRFPAFVVGSCRQLGDVVRRRIGLDAGELAEIIHRMRAVSRAAADAQKEQPPSPLTQRRERVRHPVDHAHIKRIDDAFGFVEMGTGEGHGGAALSEGGTSG